MLFIYNLFHKQKYLKIKVSQKDIDCGIQYSPHQCPIGQALSRKDKYALAGRSDFYYKGNWYKNTEELSNFISRFDSCQEVSPQKFIIPLVLMYE